MTASLPYFVSPQVGGALGPARPISRSGALGPARPTSAKISLMFFVGLLLVHVVGGLAMRELPVLATVHAIAALAVSLAVVIRGTRAADALCAIAYLAGSEVLWRMTQATVPWEYAKYAVALVGLAALGRRALAEGRRALAGESGQRRAGTRPSADPRV